MRNRNRKFLLIAAVVLATIAGSAAAPSGAQADITCQRTVTANLVVIDQPLMFNRLGAANVNGMIYALKRDVIDANGVPLTVAGANPIPDPQTNQLQLRPDRRPRPLTLRIRRGDCLTVNLQNLLTPAANPFNVIPGAVPPFTVPLDDQPADRVVGFHAAGMQLFNSIDDDGSMVGRNHLPGGRGTFNAETGNLVPQGGSRSYTLYAEKEGVFLVTSEGVLVGSDANEGYVSDGLFGQVIVEPTGARIYRGQVHEEELRLATTGYTADGHPILNYEAVYPNVQPWISEGKAGLPVLNMLTAANEIVHSEINAVVAGPSENGTFPASTYPLESAGKRNPTVPNRLEPFRDLSSQFHDETVNAQAFPGFYVADPVFRYVLAGVKDAFMINYGSGGIGSEIIANRLGVGPMHDCLDCAYEEFFLTSFTVGDPAMLVDVPANFGLENLLPGQAPPAGTTGPKAHFAIGAEDPANIHHSYTGDFAKIRNTHAGKEQHVFHLHNHQWLYNPNDDNSNYMDAQGIGPGASYTYEINFGGSGNRNKSAGDSIYHCHFYPHFAQGMWYHWRHHDVLETGTVLRATQEEAQVVVGRLGVYHTSTWGLADTTPAKDNAACVDAPGSICERVRAYPDGEIATGTPIPAVVPLPGKPMAPMPGKATVVAKVNNGIIVGSNAKVDRTVIDPATDKIRNPGFPFWIAGIEDTVGQRPPTPPLDMLTKAKAQALFDSGDPMWAKLDPNQADGWDGGLPRHSLDGYAAGGADVPGKNVVSPNDFSKVIGKAKPVYYPEEGTDLEQAAMAFHAKLHHDTYRPNGAPATGQAGFRTNGGGGPVVGAPYHNPCIDDDGIVLDTGVVGNFFSGENLTNPKNTHGRSLFSSNNPRIYKGTFLQFDVVLNKVGYHFPQQRILALWQDAGPIIAKQKAPEPMVFRFNTFDCMVYHNSNLVPEAFEMDDYEVRTPTDIIAQHIHLPKWDLTTTDGAANGWNYEDGTLSPGAVRERIEAINCFNNIPGSCGPGVTPGTGTDPALHPKLHPYFAGVATGLGGGFPAAWLGARTTTQRWFADPVVNVEGVDRGLGIIFTHDHYGPSTHQQIGLYATALVEPAGSRWVHNETGQQLGYNPKTGAPARTATARNPDTNETYIISDGGPTSWQAAILPPGSDPQTGDPYAFSGTLPPYREFYFEFSDFQHAYEAGVYMGAGQDGLPLAGTGPGLGPVVANAGNPAFDGTPENAFRFAINPPARPQKNPVFPDLFVESAVCVKDLNGNPLLGRPCPTAIDVQDPGIIVVNYRHEPVGLRIYDPNKPGPDAPPGQDCLNPLNLTGCGMQADGERGDLAFALQSRTDRAIGALNVQPTGATVINGTKFPPPINNAGVSPGDPFTPMMRAFTGDVVRVKMQSGGNEEEHSASILGMKWLQAGSGHGRAPNSGWRNAQASGISEQFTLTLPVVPSATTLNNFIDYGYSMDFGNDGWWNGDWGLLRSYNRRQNNLFQLPNNPPPNNAITITNLNDFRRLDNRGRVIENRGACPVAATLREYNISAVLANNALPKPPGVMIPAKGSGDPLADQSVGGALNPLGGTLVYNHRATVVGGQTVPDPENPLAPAIVLPARRGPIHDPTAILFVRNEDLNANGTLKADAPVEPLVLRAAAGECLKVTLTNRLPALQQVNIGTALNPILVNNSTAPDLATYSTIQGVVKRDRFDLEGSTTFNSNLVRPSSWVSIQPQLVAVDQGNDAGILVGTNPAKNLVKPGGTDTYYWYAGDLAAKRVANGTFTLYPTPVELGGAGLLPADRVKQGAKSMVGALVVEPQGSSWMEDTQVPDHQGQFSGSTNGTGERLTRAQATVCPGGEIPCSNSGTGSFRDFSLVLAKGLTQYYADNTTGLLTPVEHLNGEAVGLPEDSQEASGMALNYGVEPLWFRFGLVPQAPFGGAGCGPGCYGGVPNAHQAYSNVLTPGEDPVTPVFLANAGQEARIRITYPFGTTRGSTFALHGHVWQRDPYVCPGESQDGLAGKCNNAKGPGNTPSGGLLDASGIPIVGARAIGDNPIGFAQGGQESLTPPTHFDIVLPSAGGGNGVVGDYLFRDKASFGNASGVWGILRVE